MKILLIDTCGSTGSLALADTDGSPAVVATASLPGRTASERLIPTVKALTARHAIGLQSLGAVVVVHGPGSFTGVRVGLSAAKGLCQALDLPLIAISRLAVLAHLTELPLAGARVHALLDAGRGELYSGVYADGVCIREALLTLDEVLTAAHHTGQVKPTANRSVAAQGIEQAQVVIVCEPAVADSVAPLAPQLVAPPSAEDALPLALRRIHQGSFDDVALLDANYLRRVDAEIFAKTKGAAPAVPQLSGHQQRTPAR